MFFFDHMKIKTYSCVFFFYLYIQQVSSANLNRSYRRAPKGERQGKNSEPAGICHLCMAGTEGKEWENWRLVQGFSSFFGKI